MTRLQFGFAFGGWIGLILVLAMLQNPVVHASSLVSPGPPECPADIVPPGGDGSVNVDDLLALLSAWGACEQPFDDPAEPNDDCTQIFALNAVGSTDTDQVGQWMQSTLDAGDVDLFVFDANETDSSCECCDAFCLDEDYRVTVELTVPANATGSLRFRVDEACTTSTASTVSVAPGLTDSIEFWVDGACGGPLDSYTFHILVAGADGTVECPTPYTLTYSFDPGCTP